MSKNIVLLTGGTSPERAVSKNSSKSILLALRSLGHKVRVIDPGYGIDQPKNEEDYFNENDYTDLSNDNYVKVFNSDFFKNVDLVFIGLHGRWGEDGTVQSLCELKGLRYTGSGVLTSALAMDKYMTKIMFQHFNVITPKWFIVKKSDAVIEKAKEKINKFFGYPCVIKPNDQGSTVGLTICRGEVELELAINSALEYSEVALIEEYIAGREMTVAVLDQQPLAVLEIKPKHGIYDYECKYTSGMSEYIVPADIPSETSEYLKRQALLAYNSVGCKNYARVDFRLTNSNKSFCLEVNTLPGMTNLSLVPKMAQAAGISFEELINKIVNYSLK